MTFRAGTLAAAFLLCGVSAAQAHPSFAGSSCKVLDRLKAGHSFNFLTAEELDFIAPLLILGDTITICRGDLGIGTAQVWNFANTGEKCFLGPEGVASPQTTDWTEVIKANGETTLICRFGPR